MLIVVAAATLFLLAIALPALLAGYLAGLFLRLVWPHVRPARRP